MCLFSWSGLGQAVQQLLVSDSDDLYLSDGSQDTQSDVTAVRHEPDFAIPYFLCTTMPYNNDNYFYECHAGVQIIREYIAVLVQVKPASRGINKDDGVAESAHGLEQAEQQLLRDSCLQFTRTPRAKWIIAIAAAGLYWNWAIVERDTLPAATFTVTRSRTGSALEITWNDADLEAALLYHLFGTQGPFRLGTAESTTQFRAIQQKLVQFQSEHQLM